MKRRRFIGGALALAVVGALALLLMARLGAATSEVLLFTVRPVQFVHRVTAEGHLSAAEATPILVPSAVRRGYQIAWMAPDGQEVEEGQVVIRFDPTEIEKTATEADVDFRTAELNIAKEKISGEAEVRNLERDAELAATELQQARAFQKRDEGVFSRFEIIESEVDQALAARRERHADSSLEGSRALSRTELELLAIERRKTRLKIEQAQRALALLEVPAPHSGLFLVRRNSEGAPLRAGDTVYSGQNVAEIPDLSEMEADVYVLEADAGGLATGQSAVVVVESHPHIVWEATVQRIETLAKPWLPGSPVQYFGVTLDLDQTDPDVMKPGQRVSAEITTAEIADALVVPRQAIVDRDDRHFVFRRIGGGFETAAVELGPAGLGRVVVTSGLEPGDVIAVRDPRTGLEALDRPRSDSTGEDAGTSPSAAR